MTYPKLLLHQTSKTKSEGCFHGWKYGTFLQVDNNGKFPREYECLCDPRTKAHGMALVIGRSECDSKLAVVPNSVHTFLFDRVL